MKLQIERCDNWDGVEKVCDSDRCSEYIEKTGGIGNSGCCYHKPYIINGKRKTVKGAVLILLKAGG